MDVMNERIRELAKQTGYIWHASGDPQVYEFTPEKLDEFVKLIVREAMTVTKDYTCNQGWDYSAPVALARHFGVRG
jgi:hypothetical protein